MKTAGQNKRFAQLFLFILHPQKIPLIRSLSSQLIQIREHGFIFR